MPGLDELEFTEYADFTGGLWQRDNDRDCAPNGLLECTDCFPVPSGGLKAFASFQPISAPFTSGDQPTAPAHCVGIWVAPPGATGTTRAIYIMTVEGTSSPWTLRVCCLESGEVIKESYLAGGSAVAWDATLTRSDITLLNTGVRMVQYRDSTTGTHTNYFNLPVAISVGSTNGIWKTNTSTAAFVYNPDNATNPSPFGLWIYQNRLVTIGYENAGLVQQEAIWYSEPGGIAASTANYLIPQGDLGQIQTLAPFSPSELFYIKRQRGLGSVQGAITAPTIRDLETSFASIRNFPVRTPIGLVMVIFNEGAYTWDGNAMIPISPQILGDAMGGTSWAATDDVDDTVNPGLFVDLIGAGWTKGTNSGHLGCYDHWVLFNNGYVMDSRTGAWFTQTSAPGARYWASDYIARRVYVSCNNYFSIDVGSLRPRPAFAYWSRMGEGEWDPMSTYSFTLPLIESPGQRTNLREIEYELRTYNDTATLSLEITSLAPGGVKTETLGPYTLADTTADGVRVSVPGHPAEWYKVRTILKSNRSGVEAPTLSKMRIGKQASTRTPVNRA